MKRLIVILAVMAVALQANAQMVSGARGSEDIKIGIAGFSYRNFDIDQTLQMISSMGVKYFSVKDWWLPLDSTKEQMDQFKAKCASYGVEGYILGPIYMKSVAEVDRAFAYAGRYGSTMFIGVPDYELIGYVIEKVRETGIKVAIHTHGPDGAAFPDIYKIVEMVKDPDLGVGCCLDMGHTFRLDQDNAKILKKYSKWIYDIHIKDETAPSKEGTTWEMGRGVMDFKPIVKALRKIGYKGVVSIEFEKNGNNPHPGIAESVGYLRGVLDATK
ncbi:MAG: sugar phosphate isomerase/epimerase [Bacteroidales bacterium]|nr:sugar phosphate isomerase/epimerase [Bacteroidales bacterium]